MMDINQLTIHGYNYEAPSYIGDNKTEFLHRFCLKHDVELENLLLNKGHFRVYSVRYAHSSLNCLIHYCGQKEESVIVQNDSTLLERAVTY